ncbi:alpha-amylase family glycosyl hydrolase [Brumicola nitratireducens]|uniref:Alpha amylase, catalytic region n=1 Tax=Glaciecola nitratireducens (strain JCM 12485 / KCTC 12276 / FR1064) TaxID=1085623 RepID=G4QIL0_GLANF|nr:alpha-amylase family glycosyl hydrolase [Glaciecola nitratireducens]AEP31165.1 alpha amylase, catalytic region [Glaciecola nitratireducens FR1064]
MKIRSLANIYIIKTLILSSVLVALVACSQQSSESSKALDDSIAAKNTEYLTRDIKDDIFYFVMPDRFHNADPSNDNGDPNRPISFGGLDKTSKWAFHGGDIQGIEAKLDYIQDMGVTAIWMTPLLRNRAVQSDGFGHHGYWVIDFTEIDPHFGSNQDLRSLIDAAHARGMKVFFDIITNHTADVIKYKECHKLDGTFIKDEPGCQYKSTEQLQSGDVYTPFVLDAEKAVKFPEWLNAPKYYNNQGDSYWQGESVVNGDFAGLDDLNTSNPEVVEGMTEIFKNIIDEFKPDGFRIDTVKHVDLSFWQSFGPDIVAHAKSTGIPNFHIFGEVYDGNPAVLSKFTTAGKLPSVLDFGFHFNVKDSLFHNKDVNRLGQLFDNDDYYRDADSSPEILMNFLGNHDAGRVGFFINQGFDSVSEAEKLQRSVLGHAFMYLSRGIPVVYYGDEQGFTGDGGDVDAREDMDASLVEVYNDNELIGSRQTTAEDNFNQRHPIYQSLQKFAKLREQHKALRSGLHQNRLIDNTKRIVAFSRIDTDEKVEYLAIFNMGMQTQNVSLNVDSFSYSSVFGNNAKVQQGKLTTTLEPLSFVLLKADQTHKGSEIFNVTMPGTYIDNKRLFIPVNLTFGEQKALPLAEVDFYLVDKDGIETFISMDNTQPYRAIVMPEAIASMEELKVLVRDGSGNEMSKRFAF